MKLYFMRHGESQANVENVYAPGKTEDGGPASQLTVRGRQQAREAAAQLTGAGITRIFSSDLTRAHETARIVAQIIGFPEDSIVLEPRLREVRVGNLAGSTDYGIAGYLAHQAQAESDPAVETVAEASQRLREFLESIRDYSNDIVLLVSHGGLGMILRDMLSPDPRPLNEQPGITNAEIFQLPDPLGAQI